MTNSPGMFWAGIILMAVGGIMHLCSINSCVNVEQAPLDSTGNMECFLGSTLVFQGTLDLRGYGAYTGGESIFTGEWQLCQPQRVQVRCIVQVAGKDGGVK